MITMIWKRINERKKRKMILKKNERKNIEIKANNVLEKNNINTPRFDLIKFLTENENYEIFLQEMPKGTTGYILVKEDVQNIDADISKFIAINRELQNDPNFVQKSRFIVAHEYAHSILHKKDGIVFAHRSKSMRKTKMEREADYFARCLLMPRKLICQALNDKNVTMLNSENKIDYIAKIFDVTPNKAKERLRDLRNDK